jgi:DNA-binding NarL/FixJ family response regulator
METQENVFTPPLPTDEEISWVTLLATGEKAKGVAEKLGLNKNTFAYKLQLLRAKFNCKNTAQLISYFLRNKYID